MFGEFQEFGGGGTWWMGDLVGGKFSDGWGFSASPTN